MEKNPTSPLSTDLEPKPVVSGVPQGYVLDPILVIIYINDLHDVVKNCKTGSFADDTKLQSKLDIAEDTLDVQEDLDRFITRSTHLIHLKVLETSEYRCRNTDVGFQAKMLQMTSIWSSDNN